MPFKRIKIQPYSHNHEHYCLFWKHYNGSSFQIKIYSENNIPLPEHIANSTKSRQSEYFYGRYCAAKALNRLNVPGYSIPTGTHRKPIWPSNVKGSITHSKQHAASLVSTDTGLIGVGIDIEQVLSPEKADLISNKVISKTEMQLIIREHKKSGSGINALITLVFSAKESYFKAVYEEANRYFGFEYLEITKICQSTNSIQAKVAQDVSKNITQGKVIYFNFVKISDEEILTYCIIK